MAAIALLGCGRKAAHTCGPASDHSVVGCFEGDPITRDELAPYLRQPAVIPGRATLSDPRADAVDQAVRVRLLEIEAKRRKLPVFGASPELRRASAYQALRREVAREKNATASQVSDDEARTYYEQHPGQFNKITATYCRAIFVDDAKKAEELYQLVDGGNEEGFEATARESSKHPSAANDGDIGETHQPGVDPDVRRLSNDLRKVGDIAGPLRLQDGTYVILYASRLDMDVKPFDVVAAEVKNRIAHDREQAALDELADALRTTADFDVFDAEVALVPLPAPPAAGE